ncbi:hypothetical protein Daura_16980 [Dactylosporangium aurantiacum]|uniref:Uncharacterized protein n=1 Tax=Dactylosporangium aurantiacum TaxID=35754 RepID=A0A9Q9IQW3_9ACTN|nr:hypothetical protein [Dactylosporangium aurantiacum]MDG6103200.1 hypothetical protein [Dactylosporangium aurantiacum]UWZ57705.1 hypothetical protein Daura_16980 [Dactylosporangium aurantiacum]
MPITELTELARALLGERPSGRDVVPAQVAERISHLAAQWAAHGFTAATVGPWTDLRPAAAAVLAAAGATPQALERHVITTAGTTTTLWRAVCTGTMSAEDAAAAFKPAASEPAASEPAASKPAAAKPADAAAQLRGPSRNAFSSQETDTPGAFKAATRPAAETFKAPPAQGAEPAQEEAPVRARVAPAVFSHPAADHPAAGTDDGTDDRRRRSAPPQTPFST